jgi:hypothetical protein
MKIDGLATALKIGQSLPGATVRYAKWGFYAPSFAFEADSERAARPDARGRDADHIRAQLLDAYGGLVFSIRAPLPALPSLPDPAHSLLHCHPAFARAGDRRAGERAATAYRHWLGCVAHRGADQRGAWRLSRWHRMGLLAGTKRMHRVAYQSEQRRIAARPAKHHPRRAMRQGGMAPSRYFARRLQRPDFADPGGHRWLRLAWTKVLGWPGRMIRSDCRAVKWNFFLSMQRRLHSTEAPMGQTWHSPL